MPEQIIKLGAGHCCVCTQVCYHINGPWFCAAHEPKRYGPCDMMHCYGQATRLVPGTPLGPVAMCEKCYAELQEPELSSNGGSRPEAGTGENA